MTYHALLSLSLTFPLRLLTFPIPFPPFLWSHLCLSAAAAPLSCLSLRPTPDISVLSAWFPQSHTLSPAPLQADNTSHPPPVRCGASAIQRGDAGWLKTLQTRFRCRPHRGGPSWRLPVISGRRLDAGLDAGPDNRLHIRDGSVDRTRLTEPSPTLYIQGGEIALYRETALDRGSDREAAPDRETALDRKPDREAAPDRLDRKAAPDRETALDRKPDRKAAPDRLDREVALDRRRDRMSAAARRRLLTGWPHWLTPLSAPLLMMMMTMISITAGESEWWDIDDGLRVGWDGKLNCVL